MSVEVTPDIHEVCEKGEMLLHDRLTPEVLRTHHGKVVAIDVDTKEMVFGANFVECRKQLATNAGERIYATRVGDVALHRFGYNVDLTPQLQDMVRTKIDSGRNTCASEVISEALRLMEEQDRLGQIKFDELRREVHKGLESGESKPWNATLLKSIARSRVK